MSRIRTFAAQQLADTIAATVRFPERPNVVAAPPSKRTVYPAMSVLIDASDWVYSTDEPVEVNTELDPSDPGYLLSGFYRTNDDTSYASGTIWQADDGRYVSHIGTMRAKGRLWVGSRSGPQREQVEDDVGNLFFQDDAAPGRLMFSAAGVTVGGVVIPFGTITAVVESQSWDAEFAFDERLWSFMPFLLDAPIIVPRNYPLVQQLVLAITDDLATPIDSVADLSDLVDLSEVQVDGDGNTTPFDP